MARTRTTRNAPKRRAGSRTQEDDIVKTDLSLLMTNPFFQKFILDRASPCRGCLVLTRDGYLGLVIANDRVSESLVLLANGLYCHLKTKSLRVLALRLGAEAPACFMEAMILPEPDLPRTRGRGRPPRSKTVLHIEIDEHEANVIGNCLSNARCYNILQAWNQVRNSAIRRTINVTTEPPAGLLQEGDSAPSTPGPAAVPEPGVTGGSALQV